MFWVILRPLGGVCRGSLITMTCFSRLKGLETQPWLGLCDLFISFQAGLCELIHGGWAEEAGEGSRHPCRKQTKQHRSAAPCSGWEQGPGRRGGE